MKPLRIFIVENHADTLLYLRDFLESQGHDVQSAGTVDEALARVPASDADVLICDIGLPDGDGWELMEKLESPPFAIAMSGFGMKIDRERSRNAGFREHLTKPFSLRGLLELLEEARREKGGK